MENFPSNITVGRKSHGEKMSNGSSITRRAIVITAALTAIGTSIVSDWIPSLVKEIYEELTAQPVLLVEVKRSHSPVSGVAITTSDVLRDGVLETAITDKSGLARLNISSTPKHVHLHVSLREGTLDRIHQGIREITKWPYQIRLDLAKDFESVQVASTSHVTTNTAVDKISKNIEYGETLLKIDRTVSAVLEIDWVKGTPHPKLEVPTKSGPLTLESVFQDIGISLELQWDEELPISVLGNDNTFNQKELISVMDQHRGKHPEPVWHFYVILGPSFENTPILSLMFDTELRRGAALFNDKNNFQNAAFTLSTLIHEIGHLLNLPHPWQAYGDTRSVMTYPHRWSDSWDWKDPDVFHFDWFGRRHVKRAPTKYVKPGQSRFLDYGAPLPWRSG